MDWPSGPNTIHSVGTRALPEVPYRVSRLQIIAMIFSEATSDSPNIA